MIFQPQTDLEQLGEHMEQNELEQSGRNEEANSNLLVIFSVFTNFILNFSLGIWVNCTINSIMTFNKMR